MQLSGLGWTRGPADSNCDAAAVKAAKPLFFMMGGVFGRRVKAMSEDCREGDLRG